MDDAKLGRVDEYIRHKFSLKMIIGYTTGVFDLFHIGHLKILNRQKNCDFLIVGAIYRRFDDGIQEKDLCHTIQRKIKN